jgi:NhaP-type Na+/H+ or K+/H+ antiporter
METQASGRSKRQTSYEFYKKLYKLTVAGGVAFWAANFAISLTPIAAEYRAALSISYLPMIVESLIGGLIIGFFVSYFLLRFFDKIPTKNPILKSVILSFIVLIIVTILLGGPASFLTPSDALRYFLIGAMFNVLRILALGIVIGYLYKRLYKGFNPSAIVSESAKTM